jgi:dTDP-4-amino-4,6-dideoxygalactose transaminase
MRTVPLYEPRITWKHRRAVAKQLRSGWIGPGNAVIEFEKRLADYCGRTYAICFNSATSALMAAYKALRLRNNSLIACPAYGLPACQNAALFLGHAVKLIDIRPDGCMDVDKFVESIEERPVDAVVHVNHNGHCGEIHYLAGVCRKKGIPLIEDSAVALGVPGACQTGDMSILSFSVPKIITTGQGGAVLTDSEQYLVRLDAIRDQGGGNWRNDRIHQNIGVNLRMTDLQAALGIAQLKGIDKILRIRNKIWDAYRVGMDISHDIKPSGWIVTVRCSSYDRREEVFEQLNKKGYAAERLYRPVSHNIWYGSKADDNFFKNASDYYKRVLYLPSSLTLSYDAICGISSIVTLWR